jgi:hypothetical protein
MNTERLVLALFDVALDGDAFLCGKARWVIFVRKQQSETTTPSFASGTMFENTYFDPAAMADDLLRKRYAHAIVAWDGGPLVAALGRESAGPVMGPFLYDPTAPEVVAISRHLRRHAENPRRLEYPLVRVQQRPAETRVGRLASWLASWLERRFEVSEHTAEEEAEIIRYMQRHRAYSTLRPAGLAGKYDRHDIAVLLTGRLFDPLKWMEDNSGRGLGRACEFDWVREGLAGPQGAPPPFTLKDGLPATPERLAALWRQGEVWRVLDSTAWKVNILNQLVHVGLHGWVTTNRLEGPAGDLWLNRRERAMWRYAIDTHSWWDELSNLGHRGASAA